MIIYETFVSAITIPILIGCEYIFVLLCMSNWRAISVEVPHILKQKLLLYVDDENICFCCISSSLSPCNTEMG